jgi:hypothetical protein
MYLTKNFRALSGTNNATITLCNAQKNAKRVPLKANLLQTLPYSFLELATMKAMQWQAVPQ